MIVVTCDRASRILRGAPYRSTQNRVSCAIWLTDVYWRGPKEYAYACDVSQAVLVVSVANPRRSQLK